MLVGTRDGHPERRGFAILIVGVDGGAGGHDVPLMLGSCRGLPFEVDACAPSDVVEPSRHRRLPDQGRGLLRQGDERELRGILGIRRPSQRPPAGAQHARPMTALDLRECGFIALRDEGLQQVAVGRLFEK